MIGQYFILAALSLVAIVFLVGIAIMALGDKVAGRWSNVLMRYRIMAQGVALIVIVMVAGLASLP